jgi:hypothetical protein
LGFGKLIASYGSSAGSGLLSAGWAKFAPTERRPSLDDRARREETVSGEDSLTFAFVLDALTEVRQHAGHNRSNDHSSG